MTYTPLPIRTSDLDQLALDLDNYRIPTHRDDEAAALAYLFASEDVLEACRLILRNGYFDNEVPIVVEEGGEYVVLEGNRRVSALKAMQDPTLVPEFEGAVRALLKRYAVESENLPSQIRVIVAADREQAAPHIARLHTGLSKKAWSRDQQATYYYSLISPKVTIEDIRARYQGVPIPRFIRMAVVRRFLTGVRFRDVSLHEYVTGDALKMSSFEYAYRRKEIALRIGVAFEATGLLVPADESPETVGRTLTDKKRDALEFLLNEFRAGELNTRSDEFSSSSTTRDALLARMDAASGIADSSGDIADAGAAPAESDSPNADRTDDQANQGADGEASTSDGADDDGEPTGVVRDLDHTPGRASPTSGDGPADRPDTSSDNAAEPSTRGPNHPDTTDTLSLAGLDYGSYAPETLQRRYHELRKINVKIFPAAAAMLLRSILETTIKFHFENTATPASGELTPSVGVLAAAYGTEKPIKHQVGQIKSGGAKVAGSIQWFNLVAHSADFEVKRDDVKAAWVVVQPVLRRLLHPPQD